VYGLPGMLSSLQVYRSEYKLSPVNVYGPPGLRKLIRQTAALTHTALYPELTLVHELHEIATADNSNNPGERNIAFNSKLNGWDM
jgi:hypothetical protein